MPHCQLLAEYIRLYRLCGWVDAKQHSHMYFLALHLLAFHYSVHWSFSQAMCGLAKPVFRLPYVPLSYEQRVKGAKLLEAVSEHIPGCDSVRVLDDSEFVLIGRH